MIPGMRRTLTWLVTLPFAAASVLLGHALAYRLTGTPAGDVHGYLAHAPQVVLILASVALLGLAADTRARRQSPIPLAALAVVAFAAQEHLERLAHTGHIPFLLTSPVFWLGILLQAPLAAAVWVVSRRLSADLAARTPAGAPRLARLPLVLAPLGPAPAVPVHGVSRRGRAPPAIS
jgi:hypothetical protein